MTVSCRICLSSIAGRKHGCRGSRAGTSRPFSELCAGCLGRALRYAVLVREGARTLEAVELPFREYVQRLNTSSQK